MAHQITIADNLKTGVVVNFTLATDWTSDVSAVIRNNPVLAEWLSGEGSLTQRLSQLNGQPIGVEVLLQEQGYPNDSECDTLRLEVSTCALIREVVLSGRQAPWVFARTVIPNQSAGGSFAFINQLGNQPLGHWLFATPEVKRLGMEYTRVEGSNGQTLRFGRRSRFEYQGQCILVAEYFLPALIDELENYDANSANT